MKKRKNKDLEREIGILGRGVNSSKLFQPSARILIGANRPIERKNGISMDASSAHAEYTRESKINGKRFGAHPLHGEFLAMLAHARDAISGEIEILYLARLA